MHREFEYRYHDPETMSDTDLFDLMFIHDIDVVSFEDGWDAVSMDAETDAKMGVHYVSSSSPQQAIRDWIGRCNKIYQLTPENPRS